MITTVPPLVIPIGEQVSNALEKNQLRWASSLVLFAPTTLTGTISVEASPDGTTWFGVRDDLGVVITLASDEATTLFPVPGMFLRLSSDMAEVAERTIPVVVRENSPAVL